MCNHAFMASTKPRVRLGEARYATRGTQTSTNATTLNAIMNTTCALQVGSPSAMSLSAAR
jgi:hypothetical protein